MIIRFCTWLDSKFFPRKTINDKIAKELQEAMTEARQARRVIEDHLFTEHMSKMKIKALNDWLMREAKNDKDEDDKDIIHYLRGER